MDLEQWVIDLLNEIESAAEKGENYDLHLEKEIVREIALESSKIEWIEIY